MRSDEIVIDLDSFQDWSVHPLQPSHHLLSVSYLPVHPLHLVVDLAAQPDVSDTNRLKVVFPNKTPSWKGSV